MPRGGVDVRELSRQTLSSNSPRGSISSSHAAKLPSLRKEKVCTKNPKSHLVPSKVDANDPLYNYEEDGDLTFIVSFPAEGDADIYAAITPILKEAIVSGDFCDVVDSLGEVKWGNANHHHVVHAVISLGYDLKNVEREVCSQLLAHLSIEGFLSSAEVKEGFNKLLENLERDIIDCPQAPQLLAKFLARAIFDDCVEPSFVNLHPGLPSSLNSLIPKALQAQPSFSRGVSPLSHVTPQETSALSASSEGESESESGRDDASLEAHFVQAIMNGSLVSVGSMSGRVRTQSESERHHGQGPGRAIGDAVLSHSSSSSSVSSQEHSHGLCSSLDAFRALTPMQRALVSAAGMTNTNQRAHFIEEIWGHRHDHGRADLAELSREIHVLLDELVCSGEIEDAALSVRDLGIPHFTHEVVYQVVMLAMRDGHVGRTYSLMLKFLTHLEDVGVLSLNQLEQGFERIYHDLKDVELDIPRARHHLRALVAALVDRKVLSSANMQRVSEGDSK